MTNVDLVCLGVEYMMLPAGFDGLELSDATEEELELVRNSLPSVQAGHVRALVTKGGRFLVAASSFELSENSWDLFESPFEFRSHFRNV